MNKHTKTLTLCFLALALSFGSCTQRLIDFTVISSKNVSMRIDKSQGKNVKGSSMGFVGLGANIKDAMDKALSSAGPDFDLLVDGVVRVQSYFLVSGYKVEGTAVSSRNIKAQLGEEGYKEWCLNHKVVTPETIEVVEEN
jgi:hypothetical protein